MRLVTLTFRRRV